jgi:hypothetical protein
MGSDFPPPGHGVDIRAPAQGQDDGGPAGSDDEVHVRAASLLPFDEIKVDTDLLKGVRTSEADELICKICHTYFLGCAPKLTKCAHAFCGDCLESWIQVQPTFRSWAQVAKSAGQARLVPCPVCKAPLNDKADIHLILTDSVDPECVRMSRNLRNLPLVCHNNPTVSQSFGSCTWEGKYVDYQAHARTCTRNKNSGLVEPNTTAPPQSHSETKKAREQASVLIVIPFTAPSDLKHAVSVSAGSKVKVEEKSDSGWIYIKNDETHGWVPEYCTKRYDQWFEDQMTAAGKQVERCVAIRDFDPSQLGNIDNGSSFLPLREGEVMTVCERTKLGWNLAINSDGSKQGWVPENRCRVIREGGAGNGAPAQEPTGTPVTVLARGSTFVVRRPFESSGDRAELSLNAGEVVSVRQASDFGWTQGVVVAQGCRKEGWFPDWIIDRSTIESKHPCVVCKQPSHGLPLTFVRTHAGQPKDVYSPICNQKCWANWRKQRPPTRK